MTVLAGAEPADRAGSRRWTRNSQPFKGKWQEVLDGLAPGDREVVAGLLKDVQQLLSEILTQDEADKQSLMRQKADIGVQIKRTVTGVALNRAYGMASNVRK